MHYVGSSVPAAVLFFDGYLVKNKMVLVKNIIFLLRKAEGMWTSCMLRASTISMAFHHLLCFVLVLQQQKVEKKAF